MRDVCALTGMKKVNTTASHPQTDGLVENFNKTLRAMLAKHVKTLGSDWDVHLQQLLFAYRSKPHLSTGESPFFLLYGRDARLPTETVWKHVQVLMQWTARTTLQSSVKAWRVRGRQLGRLSRNPSGDRSSSTTKGWTDDPILWVHG